MHYIQEAQKLYDQIKLKQNIALHQVDQRLKLLKTLINDKRNEQLKLQERLKGDKKIDEILEEYSNTDNI